MGRLPLDKLRLRGSAALIIEQQLVGAGFFAAAGGGVLGGRGAVEEDLVERVRLLTGGRQQAARLVDALHDDARAAARSPWSGGRPVALAMKSAQIGAAVLPPVSPRPSFFMSSKPTHTAASRSGVKPTNQASRWSFEVPVLPAAGRRSLPAIAACAVPSSITLRISDTMT